ncbi:hypothetical protein [Aureimonas phyllosphaerae]|uniref:Uncharacterized protein n=1 Tax=Aureimonas phyllosphaerae TaxID=1166078 RepID=A0A7W6C088_9HYPH|nr:hypothetical protein [Aureimonas phyllosphaerae]MBB3938050.1 hypothetical protein [Aureimonas phyllosphaerae]MBB3962074.1 hypothetical protein [Aureimonas phyllosphaerae]SFF55049.1 hypothetical protein SAMN05216566_12612 [Aureimonas phyllosphaerae]
MREPMTPDDALLEALREGLDRIDNRMVSYENALIRGQMAPDAFVWVYRDCIEDRDHVIRKIALHEAREPGRERAHDAPTRTQAEERTVDRLVRASDAAGQDRDRTAPSTQDTLSPADIRAAVRQSQQSERPSTADQDLRAPNERDRTPDDDRAWSERSRR